MRTWGFLWHVLVLWAVLALKQCLRSARYSPCACHSYDRMLKYVIRRIYCIGKCAFVHYIYIDPILNGFDVRVRWYMTLTSMARWMQDKTLYDCQTSKWVVKMGASSSAVFCGQPTWDEKIPSWVDWCRLNMRRDIITTERLHIRGECSHERNQKKMDLDSNHIENIAKEPRKRA